MTQKCTANNGCLPPVRKKALFYKHLNRVNFSNQLIRHSTYFQSLHLITPITLTVKRRESLMNFSYIYGFLIFSPFG